MNRWKQLLQSARAYDFPCVIPAAMDRRVGVASRAWSAVRDFHSLDPADRRDGRRDDVAVAARPVHIGDDVFVGANSIIPKGTTIGDRAIIGAGSVVCGRGPAAEIWAGNPARRVRRLGEPKAAGPAGGEAWTQATGGGT